MLLTSDNKLKKLVVIGDRVLIQPGKGNERTQSGLFLPPGVQEKEKVQQGHVIKTGPGYAIPIPSENEPWKNEEEQVKYMPLQVKEGDLAIFLLNGALKYCTKVRNIILYLKVQFLWLKEKMSFNSLKPSFKNLLLI